MAPLLHQVKVVEQLHLPRLGGQVCELVNLHDESLEFEPIHRVVFHTDPQALLDALVRAYPGARTGLWPGGLFSLCRDIRPGGAPAVCPSPPQRIFRASR